MRNETKDTRALLKEKLRGCIQTGEITLSSGKVTNFYFDGRLVSLDPAGSVWIAHLVLDEIRRLGAHAVGGPTSGADPMVSAVGVLAYQQQVPLQLFYVRKSAKSHGTKKMIEGPPLSPDMTAVLVDDTLTTGGSLLVAHDALREETGIHARAAIVVVDREEGGRECLAENGIEVSALFRKADFLP